MIADYPFPVERSADSLARNREIAQRTTPAAVRRMIGAVALSNAILQAEVERAPEPAKAVLSVRGKNALRDVYQTEIVDRDNAQLPGDVVVELLPSAEERIIPMTTIRDSVDVALAFESMFSDLSYGNMY